MLERQVDHAVRGGRRAPQHAETVEGAALRLGSGRGEWFSSRIKNREIHIMILSAEGLQ